MQINLRKAKAIQGQIEQEIALLDFSNTVKIDKFSSPFAVIDSIQSRLLQQIGKALKLNEALYAIRKLSEKAAHNAGIADILNDRVRLKRIIDIQSHLTSTDFLPSKEEIEARFNDLRVSAPVTSPYPNSVGASSFSVRVISKFESDDVRKIAQQNKKTIRILEDKLLDLNVKTEITLDDITIATLTSEGII